MLEQSFNIHDIVSFKLINHLSRGGLMQKFNPEYSYFEVDNTNDPDFLIHIGDYTPDMKGILQHDNRYYIKKNFFYTEEFYNKSCSWNILINDIEESCSQIFLDGQINGFRNLFKYSVLKNIFVRPMITQHLIRNNAALIHSCAASYNGKGFLFAGRPGVFKTSIILDLIRKYGAEFIGEENSVIKDGYVYSFPLNIKSLEYKINHFKDEKPSGKIQKAKLAKYVLNNRNETKIAIAKPCKIGSVAYIKKGKEFSIKEDSLDNLMSDFIENEILEIGIPPTHTFTGIENNYYYQYLKSYNSVISDSTLKNLWNNLTDIIKKSYRNAKIYSIIVPPNYDENISENIVKEIINNG
jgi:hypothetical protein